MIRTDARSPAAAAPDAIARTMRALEEHDVNEDHHENASVRPAWRMGDEDAWSVVERAQADAERPVLKRQVEVHADVARSFVEAAVAVKIVFPALSEDEMRLLKRAISTTHMPLTESGRVYHLLARIGGSRRG